MRPFLMKTLGVKCLLMLFFESAIFLMYQSIWDFTTFSFLVVISPDFFWLSDLMYLVFNLPSFLIMGSILADLMSFPIVVHIGITRLLVHKLGLVLIAAAAHLGIRVALFHRYIPWHTLLMALFITLPFILLLNFAMNLVQERRMYFMGVLLVTTSFYLSKGGLLKILPSEHPYNALIYGVVLCLVLVTERFIFTQIDLQ